MATDDGDVTMKSERSCFSNDELEELKIKYENTDKNLQCLKKLAVAAVADYEQLKSKYEENLKQYDEVREKLREAEDKLSNLQNVLEPACEEFNKLHVELQVERECRSEAEKYASKTYTENHKLKRQSQMLLDKLQNGVKTTDLSILETITDESSAAESGADCSNEERVAFNKKIAHLEEEVKNLQNRLVQSENDRHSAAKIAAQQQTDLVKKCKRMEVELFTACKRLQDHEQAVENFKRTSQLAFGEYSDLKQKYEEQLKLNQAAETFASQMYRDREAMKRQSSVLLSSVVGDQRMMEAMMEIENLTKELENIRHETKTKIEEYETLLAADANTKKIADMETELQIAGSEVTRLQSALEEAEVWKEQMMKENKDLAMQLDKATRPPTPPPPPPPPPPFVGSTKLVIAKPKVTPSAAALGPTGNPLEQTKAALMEEMAAMMKRIQTGGQIGQGTVRKRANEIPPPTHMNELQKILQKRTNSTSSSPGSSTTTTPTAPGSAPPGKGKQFIFPASSTQKKTPPPTLSKPSVRRGSADSGLPPGAPRQSNLPEISEEKRINGAPTDLRSSSSAPRASNTPRVSAANSVDSRTSSAPAPPPDADTITNL